jgi:hypothetical protein
LGRRRRRRRRRNIEANDWVCRVAAEPEKFCFSREASERVDGFLCRGTVFVQTQWSYFTLLLRRVKMDSILDLLTCRNENNEHRTHIQAA